MRLIMLAAFAAMTFAQSVSPVAAKVKAEGISAPSPTAERVLDETEVLKISLSEAKIQLLREKYKVDDFNKEVGPLGQAENAVVKAACLSVGVSESDFQTYGINGKESRCSFSTGLDQNGNPVISADGKPVTAKVAKVTLVSTSGEKSAK